MALRGYAGSTYPSWEVKIAAGDMAQLTRRRTLGLIGGCGVALGAALASGPRTSPTRNDGLRYHAARKGLDFGTMVTAASLNDSKFRRVLLQEAATLVPAFEMKWGVTNPKDGQADYRAAEAICRFAAAHHIRMRGHAAMWYRNIPAWAAPKLREAGATQLVLARVQAVISHFRGRLAEWDVVNEAIEPNDALPMGLRRAPFDGGIGADWIADCFHAARAADPAAKLFYNEYGVECDTPGDAARRTAVLKLLTFLRERGAPINGLGIQSHLALGRKFSETPFANFLASVADLGLEIRLTELDVADARGPTDQTRRDLDVASYARRYLDVALNNAAVKGLMTWGLADKDSWLRHERWAQRTDGQLERPLALDDNLQRKPLWTAIAQALDAAPRRQT